MGVSRHKRANKPKHLEDDANTDGPPKGLVLPEEATGTPRDILKVAPVCDDSESPHNEDTQQGAKAEEISERDTCATDTPDVVEEPLGAAPCHDLATFRGSLPEDGTCSTTALFTEVEKAPKVAL